MAALRQIVALPIELLLLGLQFLMVIFLCVAGGKDHRLRNPFFILFIIVTAAESISMISVDKPYCEFQRNCLGLYIGCSLKYGPNDRRLSRLYSLSKSALSSGELLSDSSSARTRAHCVQPVQVDRCQTWLQASTEVRFSCFLAKPLHSNIWSGRMWRLMLVLLMLAPLAKTSPDFSYSVSYIHLMDTIYLLSFDDVEWRKVSIATLTCDSLPMKTEKLGSGRNP